MKKNAEELFFRYESGMCRSFCETTLIGVSYELPYYLKFIEKRPQKFLLFLSELPKPILAYYLHIHHWKMNFEFLDHETLQQLQPASVSNDLIHALIQSLRSLPPVEYLHNCSDHALLAGLRKKNQDFSYTDDLLIYIAGDRIQTIEIANDYRKQLTKKDPVFESSKQAVLDTIETFKEKNRLALLF